MYRFLLIMLCMFGWQPTCLLAMTGVEGLRWGQTPQEVVNAWNGKFELAQQPEDPLGRAVYELKYKGNVLGTYDDGVISAIFYLNRLFSIAVSYGSNTTRPASEVFELLVAKMTARFGPPAKRSQPQEMHSFIAVKDVPPISKMPAGQYQLLDMQIQTGFWIPEATWSYGNGASIRILIQKGPTTAGAMSALSPLLIFSKTNILE